MNIQHISNLIFQRLEQDFEGLQSEYFSKNKLTTTKFFILDNLLPEDLTLKIYESFPHRSQYSYRSSFREKKLTFAKLDTLKDNLADIATSSFQTKEVINIIGKITKINDLEPDPSLYAGGLSRMDKGHFLNPHIDNSHDALRKKYRRLNILFYVTPNIRADHGGNFELWDKDVIDCIKIPSIFNRLVVMETNKSSWHSVDIISEDITRCCLSNYYFSKASPLGKDYYHVTSFNGRPDQILLRVYSRFDNFIRQSIASTLNISRGKSLRKDQHQ